MIPGGAASPLSVASTGRRPSLAQLLALPAALGVAVFSATAGFLVTAVVAIAVLAAVAVALVPQAAALAFAFLLYANAPGVATQVYGVPYLVAGLFTGLLVVPLAAMMLQRQPIVILPVLLLASAFGLAMLLSSLQAIRLEPALERLLVHASEGVLLVFLVTNVIRTERMLRATLWALLLAGGFLAALSIHQGLTGDYGATYGGFALIPQGAGALPPVNEGARLGGPVSDPNRYAQILLTLLPIAVYAHVQARNSLARASSFIIGIMALVATYLTQSRGAAIAIVSMLSAGVVVRVIPLRIVVFITILVVAGLAIAGPVSFDRLLSVPELQPTPDVEGNVDLSALARLTLNLAAWNVFLDNPVLGVGPGNFALVAVDYANELGLRHFSYPFRAHNLYLEIAAELGIVGLATFLCLVGYLLKRLWQVRNQSRIARPESAAIATALLFSLMAYLLTGVFLHLSFERYFWFLIALSGAALAILPPPTVAATDPAQ